MRGLIFFAMMLVSCGATQPVSFKPGEATCDFCRMSIVDMRFKSEILSPTGKVTHFDSIECMQAWALENPKEVGSEWVTDFDHPERWIDVKKASIVKSKTISSPMGGSLIAYPEEHR